jgi:hypothetical protein
LSDLLGELGALGVLNGAGERNEGNGAKGEKGGGHKVSTVTVTKATVAAAGGKNDTCQAGKEHTKTFTQQAAGVAGGTGYE